MRRRHGLILFGLLALGLFGGCRGTTPTGHTPERKEVLGEIGAMYNAYVNEHRSAPRSLTDLDPYEPANQAGFRALRDGECVLYWGPPPKADPAATILAYDKSVPETGGCVLLLDGTIKELSASEFRDAPKVGK
jgi:hypothetical protein